MGNQQSQEKTAKFVAKTALVITLGTVLGPGALIATGASTWFTSKVVKECCENEDIKEICCFYQDIGEDLVIGAIGGELLGAVVSKTTSIIGKQAGKEIAKKGITNGARVLINSGKTIRRGKKAWEFYQEIGKPVWQISKHINHLDRNIDYDFDCEICKED